jgi:hypothetical protein
MYRDGLLLGFALGFGNISSEGCGDICGSGLGFELHIGGMLNPRLGLMFDGWWTAHAIPNSDATTWHSVYTAALQYFLTDILWLKGGAGVGNIQITDSLGTASEESGFALMGALGVEVLQSNGFALDLQARLGRGFYGVDPDATSLGLLVGFNWY